MRLIAFLKSAKSLRPHLQSKGLFTRARFSELNTHSMRIASVHIVSDNLRIESNSMHIEPIHIAVWFESESKVDRQLNVGANLKVM